MKIKKVEDFEKIENIYAYFQAVIYSEEESIVDLMSDSFIDYDDAVKSLEKYKFIKSKDCAKLIKFKFDFDGHDSLNFQSLIEDCSDYDSECEDNVYCYLLALIIVDHRKYQEFLFKDMLERDAEFARSDVSWRSEIRTVSDVDIVDIPDYAKEIKFKL
jgi:hypothetical protein